MYLLPIHVPIYTHGTERLLATDWKRSLLLLRDSLQGRYGRVRVIAPTLPAAGAQAEQLLEPVHASDEIELVPSFSWDTRAREFWAKHVHTWRADIAAALPETDVVHTGFCDVYRPLVFLGFLAALRARKPTVFVQDTDQVLQHSHLSAGAPLKKRAQVRAYNEIFERSVRYGVARASLSLLKGRALHKRYGQYAANAKNFHDTSYFSQEIVARDKIEHRIATLLSEPRPLRVCYCGRLEARKGLAHSIEAVAAARALGARVSFDIIGDGFQREALQAQIERLGLRENVRLLGSRNYGPQLLAELASYDALLFTPLAEDTPRMIFDGYAAGLPLLGYGVEYVREREAEDRAARSTAVGDTAAAAQLLLSMDRDRTLLAALARRAHEAGLYHAADAWYRRRADWTAAAVDAHRSAELQADKRMGGEALKTVLPRAPSA